MKSILLIRHAKSSWDYNVDDFDRPLNERGERDAPDMAKRLLKKDIKIHAFVSSPAVRAFSTANYFAEAFDVKTKHIVTVPALYHPSAEVFYDVISEFDDDWKKVAVFSHNPGITDFANMLTNTKVDDMPTCSIYAVKADIKHWKDFEQAEKEFWFFDYPKNK